MAPNDTNPNLDNAGATPEPKAEPILDVNAINEAVTASVNNEINQQTPAAEPEAESVTVEANPESVNIDATPVADETPAEAPAETPAETPAEEPIGGAVDFDAQPENLASETPNLESSAPIAPETPETSSEKPETPGAEQPSFVDGDLADNDAKPAESAEPPVVAENVVTAPGAKKTNRNLFIALAGVAVLAIVIIAIIVIISM
ncbi:hypothetical protein IIY67_02260 [Candidatus Saccharibacteria bacterium]|nr:hypothetical protein [Candidatus Saccharibacteria bacterium]